MTHPESSSRNIDIINCALIVLVYLIIILFSRAYTVYPLDDDWSYMRAAETFFKTGTLSFTPWTSPSLVFQVLWGTALAYVLGFSANTLVLSTQLLSLSGMVFFYLLLRRTQATPRDSLILTMVFLFNPFSFPLLFTFFTDHHFTALVIMASYFYYRGASENSRPSLLTGALCTSCAVLVRQPGLLVAGAAGVYLIMRRHPLQHIIIAVLLPVITYSVFTYWFQFVHGPTLTSQQQMQWIVEALSNPVYLISKFLNRPLLILEFLGFSLIPVSLALLPSPGEMFARRQTSLLLIACLAGVIFYLMEDHVGIHSSLYTWMNGFHFAFVSEYGYRGSHSLLLFCYTILDVLSVFSIVHIVWLGVKNRTAFKRQFASPLALPALIVLFQLLFLMIVRYKFTRYYLVVLPFCMLLLVKALPLKHIKAAYLFPLLAGFAVLSLSATQDFLAFNQARWDMGERALAQGIPVRQLSAGFPWDCWHNIEYSTANPGDVVPHSHDIPWWFEDLTPGIDPRYIISSSTVPSGFYYLRYFYNDTYTVEAMAEYYSLLYMKSMRIFLLKRQARAETAHPWQTSYTFIDNVIGASFFSGQDGEARVPLVKAGTGTVNGQTRRVLSQPSLTGMSFRLSLPSVRCRLRAWIATDPGTWESQGDGIIFKIRLSDNLLENLFDEVGMIGVQERIDFFKPRSYFLGPRTVYMHYLDPKSNPAQRAWHSITVDLSRFAGKTVDLSLEADPGLPGDDRFDTALWGEPVIETY